MACHVQAHLAGVRWQSLNQLKTGIVAIKCWRILVGSKLPSPAYRSFGETYGCYGGVEIGCVDRRARFLFVESKVVGRPVLAMRLGSAGPRLVSLR